jgi:hypothetical protein
VKECTFSTLPAINQHGVQEIFLDGINNPGFSGAPCIHIAANQPQGRLIPNVCGIVKGYVPHPVTLETHIGEYVIEANSGIIEVQSIKHLDEIQVD